MSITRWLPTFLAFPVGGYVAIQSVGSLDGPVTAAIGGLIVGAIIGIAQWLALRSRGIGARWAVYTAAAMMVGSAIAAALTDAATSVGALVVTGMVTGAVVGVAQSAELRRGRRVAAAWTVVMSLAWGAGWLISANVLVDEERGFYSFGASGALVVTLITGYALRRILAGTGVEASAGTPAATATPVAGVRR